MINQSELLGIGIYSSLALLAAIALILLLGYLLQLDRKIGSRVSTLIVPAMGLGIALSGVLSSRNLKYAAHSIEAVSLGDQQGDGNSLLRLITVAIVGLSVATIIGRVFRYKQGQVLGSSPALYISFIAFYACNALLNAIFGTVPAFSHNTLYVPVVVTAVFVWRDQPIESFVRAAKLMLVLFMATCLVAAVAKPELALEPGYKGWIPGLTVRLWGVGSNPNSIGPLSLVLLLLELLVPSSRTLWRNIVFALGLSVLALAQSKTAWVAGAAVLPILAWFRYGRAPGGGMRIGFLFLIIATILVICLFLIFGNSTQLLKKLSGGQVGSDISTLSGRLQIWAAAIRAWQDNPVFGYGPTAWGVLHRTTIGLPFAFSAHNQFLQSLSVAGTLGLVSLLVYQAVLGIYCYRIAAQTKGVSLALFAVVFLRCFTEAPFSSVALFNGEMLTQILLFRVALLGAPKRQPRKWRVPVPAERSLAR